MPPPRTTAPLADANLTDFSCGGPVPDRPPNAKLASMVAARALLLARAALLWERAAPVLAAPLAALSLYALLALSGVFAWSGDPGRAVCALTFFLAAAFIAARAAKPFRWPTPEDARRRVEADSELEGRPFEALADKPATGSDAMWAAHEQRMRESLKGAKARRPRAAWAVLDAHGLRIGAVLTLGVGVLFAGDLAPTRLGDAFSPRPMAGGGASATLDWWIEPPAYTGRPTVFLRDRTEIEAPAGSVLAGRLSGARRPPRIDGAQAVVERLGEDVHRIEATLTQDATIVLRAGALARRLVVSVAPDQPPELSLVAEPESDADGRLSLEFLAEDDYGVERYALELRPDPAAAPGADPEEWRRIDIPASGVSGSVARVDVARDVLSGEAVEIRLAGVDAAGQTGVTAPLAIALPERVFLDGLARAVADERRRFLRGSSEYAPMPELEAAVYPIGAPPFLDDQPERRIERAPESIRRLAFALDAVSDAPSAWFDDPIVYLGLRTALFEVRRAREAEALGHLDEDLWDIALRAELGSLADAREALQAAEEALFDALARGADALELGPLFDAYERAMQRYLQALARESVLAGEQGGAGGGTGLESESLQALLDALRDAAELGDTADARRALQTLSELLRNLQIQLSGGGQGGDDWISEALRGALEELGELLGEQRSLLDETFDRGEPGDGAPAPGSQGQDQQGEPGQPDEGRGGEGSGLGPAPDLAERQAGIAEQLQFMRDLLADALEEDGAGAGGEASDSALQAAREAMERAEEALRAGEGEEALAEQGEALSQLRAAAAAAAEALEERMARDGSDPLGRPGALPGLGEDTDVPSESDRQRARSILEELRRRAAEQGRPQEELDYIDRLLERF